MYKLLLLLLISLPLISPAQTIEPAPSDKAVVCFVRASGLGALINFTYFDSADVIGRFNGPKWLRYECEPGSHVFWARSENRDFVQAHLEAGKIYIIDVVPVMGGLKAGVRLTPVNTPDYKLKNIQKLIAKQASEAFSEAELASLQEDMEEVVIRGLEKYEESQGRGIPVLEGMSFLPEELVFVKQ